MDKYLNIVLALLILIIVTAVCSTFFYKKGQKNAWELSQQLLSLNKGNIYLCVEKTDANGFNYLTVKEISKAINDDSIEQKELRFRLKLALNGKNLQEYNDKYRGGKKGL